MANKKERTPKTKQRRSIPPPDVSEISRGRTAKRLRADIATWMDNPSGGPGGTFFEGDNPCDPLTVYAVLMHWLVAARKEITAGQARDSVAWVAEALGVDRHDLQYGAGLIGLPDSPDVTLNEAMQHYGDSMKFVLYMLLLSGGLVATVGNKDPEWLKQFELPSSA